MFLSLWLLASPSLALITVCDSGCDQNDANTAIITAPAGEVVELGDGIWPVQAMISRDLTVRAANPGMALVATPYADFSFTVDQPITLVLQDLNFEEQVGGILRAVSPATLTLTRIQTLNQSPEGALHLIDIGAGGQLTMSDSTFSGYMHAPSQGAVLRLAGGVSATVTDVDIDGGIAYSGGAVEVDNGVATFTRVDFRNGSAVDNGGAMVVGAAGFVTLDSCTFDGNTASYGGHVYNQGVLDALNSTFRNGSAVNYYPVGGTGGALLSPNTVTGCTFEGNTANDYGAAIFGYETQIADSVFTDNRSEYRGGAVALFGNSPVTATVSNSVFTGNSVNLGQGGAIYAGWGRDLTVSDSQFINNYAQYGDVYESSAGGAIFAEGPAALSFHNSLFSGNTAAELGGAVAILYNTNPSAITNCTFEANGSVESGGAFLAHGSSLNVVATLFCDNWSNGEGGGLQVTSTGPGYASEIAITGSAFVRNRSDAGAGAFHTGPGVGPVWVRNNDFLDNDAAGYGSAVALWQNGDVDIRNNIFAWNSNGLGAIWLEESTGATTIDYNLYWQNAPGDLSGLDAVRGQNDQTGDALFTNYYDGIVCGEWDLSLLPGSPAIDAGDPTIQDQDGSTSDIGSTGGPLGDVDPGWNPVTGTGTGTGGPTGTGSGTGTGTGASFIDEDNDGFSPPFDCDDGDASVHPGAREVPNDGKDNDCSGAKTNAWLGGRTCDQGGGSPSWLALAALVSRRR